MWCCGNGTRQCGSNRCLPLKCHQERSIDSPPAGHQCLFFLFDFSLTYYELISPQQSWQHFEAPLKTELSNGIRAPCKIHLFFISLMCVPASGSVTCTTHQGFFPSCCPFMCLPSNFLFFSSGYVSPNFHMLIQFDFLSPWDSCSYRSIRWCLFLLLFLSPVSNFLLNC